MSIILVKYRPEALMLAASVDQTV